MNHGHSYFFLKLKVKCCYSQVSRWVAIDRLEKMFSRSDPYAFLVSFDLLSSTYFPVVMGIRMIVRAIREFIFLRNGTDTRVITKILY